MIIHNCEQRSAIWFNLRLGKITGSNAHKLTTNAKFESYYYELLAESIARTITEGHCNEAMQWGIDNEPFAAEWYMQETKQDIEICGFIEHDTMLAGCSPDLLVGDKGMAQIKCPSTKNHLWYRDIDIMTSKDPSDKQIAYQIQWELFIAEREWSDFISFDPRCKGMIGHIQRVYRDAEIINGLEIFAKKMQGKIEMFLFDNGIKPFRYVPPTPPPISEFDFPNYLRA